MKSKQSGLTMVELLTVAAIISLLIGLLIPALSTVRRIAKETKQKAQLTAIDLALTTFKNDYGDYPPSNGWYYTAPGGPSDYCGAQKLAEALLGWDLLGFHPKSAWRADGLDASAGPWTYDPLMTRDSDGDGVADTLHERKGRYLELGSSDAFRLGITAQHDGRFDFSRISSVLAPAADTFVLCDAFAVKKIRLANGKMAAAGSPILYYKANTAQKTIRNIYEVRDNDAIADAKEQEDHIKKPSAPGGLIFNPLGNPANVYDFFYRYIQDPKITANQWPYRHDSYLLISAGADGFYGTGDDICNFGN